MKKENRFYEKAISAIAGPFRMTIVEEIAAKGEIRCCDVEGLTGLSQPTCSHHIKLLVDSKLIDIRKQGRSNFISLNKDNFKKLGQYFEKLSG